MSNLSKRLKAVSKQSAVVAAGGAASIAGTADAGVLMFPDCAPEITCSELNLVVETGKTKFFDLNGDARNDFSISVKNKGGKEFAKISGLQNEAPSEEFMLIKGEQNPNTTKAGVFTSTNFKVGLDDVVRLESGDSVQGKIGFSNEQGVLYDGDLGPFANPEDGSGYVGLFIDTLFGHLGGGDDLLALQVEQVEVEPVLGIRNFGWVELVRGSVNTFRIGFQSTPNAAAPIPGGPIDVPEPASLPLMALGAAGLFAMRRKMAA